MCHLSEKNKTNFHNLNKHHSNTPIIKKSKIKIIMTLGDFCTREVVVTVHVKSL